jgi:voltage-gated potassium channel
MAARPTLTSAPAPPAEIYGRPATGWRLRVYTIIFEADTRAGRAFDVSLIGLILLSVFAVMLESISGVRVRYGAELFAAEWAFTILFTVEFLRLASVRRPLGYAMSFFGVVDLLAVVTTYLSLLVSGSHYLLVVRILRLLRVFRVLKLAEHLTEAGVLMRALRASRRKTASFS